MHFGRIPRLDSLRRSPFAPPQDFRGPWGGTWSRSHRKAGGRDGGADRTGQVTAASQPAPSGSTRRCQRSTLGSGDRPCSENRDWPPGLSNRRASAKVARGDLTEQRVKVQMTVSNEAISNGRLSASPSRTSTARPSGRGAARRRRCGEDPPTDRPRSRCEHAPDRRKQD